MMVSMLEMTKKGMQTVQKREEVQKKIGRHKVTCREPKIRNAVLKCNQKGCRSGEKGEKA